MKNNVVLTFRWTIFHKSCSKVTTIENILFRLVNWYIQCSFDITRKLGSMTCHPRYHTRVISTNTHDSLYHDFRIVCNIYIGRFGCLSK